MKPNIIQLLILTLIVSVAALVAGCKNTAHGAGEDIEKMGEKIQEKTD
jgi:predicted small secreted protein